MADDNCPECGERTHRQLKDEAGYAKYWFVCTCGWESRTFRGPCRDESEIDEIGYEAHVSRFRAEAHEEAEEVAVSKL